jgi:ribosomal protein L14
LGINQEPSIAPPTATPAPTATFIPVPAAELLAAVAPIAAAHSGFVKQALIELNAKAGELEKRIVLRQKRRERRKSQNFLMMQKKGERPP